MHNFFGQKSMDLFSPLVSLNSEVTGKKGGEKMKGYEEPVVILGNFNLFCHKQYQLPVLPCSSR